VVILDLNCAANGRSLSLQLWNTVVPWSYWCPQSPSVECDFDMSTSRRTDMAAGAWPPFKSTSTTTKNSTEDARTRKRLKVSLPVHLRPFDSRFAEIEDVGQVVDFTRDGLYFKTAMPHYFMGMRLIVTFPFGEKVSAHRKFLASVVRLEHLDDDSRGIAVRFLL
jgi:hypothetical protein